MSKITVETCGKSYCEHYPEGLFVCAKCREESTIAHDKACAKLAEARAEIERKDALIEQMRDALKHVRQYSCSHMQRTTHDMIDAALSAAGRGK